MWLMGKERVTLLNSSFLVEEEKKRKSMTLNYYPKMMPNCFFIILSLSLHLFHLFSPSCSLSPPSSSLLLQVLQSPHSEVHPSW